MLNEQVNAGCHYNADCFFMLGVKFSRFKSTCTLLWLWWSIFKSIPNEFPMCLSSPDQIALPDFNAGAMENWGLVTYRETALLYDPIMSSTGNKERVTTVISHELAHMVGHEISPKALSSHQWKYSRENENNKDIYWVQTQSQQWLAPL